MIESFRQLDVYQKAYFISKEMHQHSLKFPKHEQYALADQLRRSSKSICANIAEGFGKQRASKPEFKRFLSMALGSAHEVLVWIDYVHDFEYVDQDKSLHWKSEMESIVKMLHNFYTKV